MDKLDDIKNKQYEMTKFDIERAFEKKDINNALTSVIYEYAEQIIKLKQKLEIINSTVSKQYYN